MCLNLFPCEKVGRKPLIVEVDDSCLWFLLLGRSGKKKKKAIDLCCKCRSCEIMGEKSSSFN